MQNNYIQFYTATILEWKPLLKENKYKQIITDCLRFLVAQERIKVFGFVLMPNHIHVIWKINDGLKRSDVQRDFMKYTAQQIKFDLTENQPELLRKFEVNAKDRKFQIWERNPLSINIYSRKILEQKLNYIHNNPVETGFVTDPIDYKYSSARNY